MSTLSGHVEDYLRLRRALGYKLERAGHLLPQLVGLPGGRRRRRRSPPSWRSPGPGCRPAPARTTGPPASAVARGFARYLQTIEPATEVPPAGVFPARRHRPAPYLWSQQRHLPAPATAPGRCARRCGQPPTRRSSGCSPCRACASVRRSASTATTSTFDTGVITIRHAKFDRTRLVPLHATTTAALHAYATERDRLCPTPRSSGVLRLRRRHRGSIAATWPRRSGRSPPRWGCAPTRSTHGTSAEAQLRRPDPDRLAPIRCARRRAHRHPVDLPRPRQPGRHLLVPVGVPGADGARRRSARRPLRSRAMSALAPALQAFFTDRLIGQRAASPNTIAAYRTRPSGCCSASPPNEPARAPSALDIAELDAPLIAAFLDHLEHDRHNSVATRNSRLAAIHSLFGYLALHHPEHAGSVQRVLAIPAQADPAQPRHLPDRGRGRRAARLLRPDPLDRTSRSRHVRPRPSRPGCASPNSPDSTAATSPSPPAPTCTPSAKAARRDARRSSPPPGRSSRPGSASAPARRATRCSRPPPADASAPTPSSDASPTTSPSPP